MKFDRTYSTESTQKLVSAEEENTPTEVSANASNMKIVYRRCNPAKQQY